jgi:PAS domain S-box-containing protein
VSPQFENLLGYSFEETIGKSPFSFIDDNNISKIIKQSDAIVEKATPFNSLVNKYKHRNGEILYFETSGVPVYNPSGKLSGYRGVSRDITKRFYAEKELHKLSMVVEQSPNTVIITNLNGKIEYINPAGCALSGYTSEELNGRNPSVFSSGDTPTETYSALWKKLKSGNEWKGIFHNKKKTGERYWESAFIIPLRDEEGNITNYLGVKEDITTRLQSEIALVESEERYRQLFESSPDAIILADAETGMLIDANTAACSMLGRSLEELKQFHQTMLHPPKKKEIVSEMFHEHVASSKIKEMKLPIESSVLRSDGSEISVEVLASSITLAGRQVLQGVFRDITERKLAREELLKAKEKAEAGDKLKSAFLNNISHELRTPLNGIIGFSEMITQMDNTAEDRLEFSKMIKRSSARLVNTITSYMDISMLVSGNTEINKRSFSLCHFLDKIHNQTVETCQSRNLALNIIKIDIDKHIQIQTDENLLTKIFSHLIDNAIKFTKEGSIAIGYEKKQSLHQFSVSDTGKGISKDALAVIFEIFMQADLSTSRGHEGSGLGLSIAQGFIKLLGGNIWVESDNRTGSAFFFTIPEKTNAPGSPDENEINRIRTDSKPHVVLIAEDEDSNFKYLEIVLKKAMYKVLRANDGIEAVEKCRSHPEIDILLLDLKMPGMDGFEAAKKIRNILPQLPIIALSAYVSTRDEEAAMQAGCTEYVVKPISKTRLLETITRLLRK